MEVLASSIDLMRIIFLLGAVFALLYKKNFGVTPGGIIVPGTLAAILISSFTAFLVTLAASLACWLIYRYAFGRYTFSSRWSSLINVSISVCIGLGLTLVPQWNGVLNQEFALLSLVTPGLISIGAQKYSMPKVLLGALSVTALACVSGWLISLLVPYGMLTNLSVQLAAYTPLTLTNPYIVLPFSMITAILVYYRFGIRGGGYLVAPFLAAAVVSSPLQGLLIFAGVAASYGAVHMIQKYTFIIGLERFVLSLFCGYFVITLIDLLAVNVGIADYRPAPLVLIIAVAVLTNDLTLQPLRDSIKKGFSPSMAIAYVTRLVV